MDMESVMRLGRMEPDPLISYPSPIRDRGRAADALEIRYITDCVYGYARVDACTPSDEPDN
jgi:hypothetical protein